LDCSAGVSPASGKTLSKQWSDKFAELRRESGRRKSYCGPTQARLRCQEITFIFSKGNYVYNKTGEQPVPNVLLQRNVTETTGRNVI
jgi:hypothetical protein